MYYIVFASLLFASPIAKKADSRQLTNFFYIMLLLLGCLRFGMGRDYFSYYLIYSVSPDNFDGYFNLLFKDGKFHLKIGDPQEFGFGFFITLFKTIKLPVTTTFLFFMAFIAFVNISLVLYTIQKYSVSKPLSIFIFFCNYWLWYVESGIRSSMAIAIFIYAYYSYISSDKRIFQTLKYCFFVFLGMSFHLSAFITIIIPFIIKIPVKTLLNPFFLIIMTFVSLALSLVVPIVFRFLLLTVGGGAGVGYLSGRGMWSITSIGLRLFYFFLVYIMVRKRMNELSYREVVSIKVLFVGIFIYLMLSPYPQMSRLCEFFMFVEIILLPNLLVMLFSKQKRSLYQFIMIVLFTFLLVKDAQLNMERSTTGNLLGYEYVSIFNKKRLLEIHGYGSFMGRNGLSLSLIESKLF